MTAWDEMFLAKAKPGQIECPYVAGMNITSLPTATFSVAHTVSKVGKLQIVAGRPTYSEEELGSTDYTMLLWCSSATIC
jgi:hypothetical protein